MARGLRGTLAVALVLLAAPPAWGAAPGAPGEPANWTDGDKDGFGSATALESTVWFTLDDGAMTEVYFPDLGTPSVRDLQFAVSDGRTFTENERDDATRPGVVACRYAGVCGR
jgi:glucoamylase